MLHTKLFPKCGRTAKFWKHATGLAPGATSEVCVPGTYSETGELCPASIDCVLGTASKACVPGQPLKHV